MPRILVNGVKYDVSVDKNGSPRVAVSSRPSQYGDPGDLTFAEWRVDGHDFNSVEMIPPGGNAGYLGRDYGVNTDGRWPGIDCLGPLVNTVTLSTYDNVVTPGILNSTFTLNNAGILGPGQTVSNANGMALIQAGGSTYGYITRGTKPARVNMSTMALAPTTLELDAAATDIIATKPADATVRSEVSIGQGDSLPYYVVQEPDITASTDVWAANNDNEAARVFGVAPDRTVLVAGNAIKGNVQTGSVTMENPNWQTVATIDTQDIRGTGFAMDGNLWVVSTSDGPYMLDSQTGDFFPLIPELDNDNLNGLQTTTWSFLGVILPLRYSLRYQRYGSGQSFGPETFQDNRTPVQGTATGVAGSPRELFTAIYNPATGDTYIVVWMPNNAISDAFSVQHSNPLSPFVIAKFTSTASNFLKWVGTVNSVRTNPTLMGGYGSNAFYITCGRTSRWLDDSNYRTALSGQTFLTELHRQPGLIKDIEWTEFESDDCAAGRTIQLALSIDDAAYVNIGSSVTSDGQQRAVASSGGVPSSSFHGGYRIKPRVTYTSNVSTTTPKITGGTIRIYYRVRPRTIRTFKYTLDLTGGKSKTSGEAETALRDLIYSGPILVEDVDSNQFYARLISVSEPRMEAVGNAGESSRGNQRVVDVVFDEWTTA